MSIRNTDENEYTQIYLHADSPNAQTGEPNLCGNLEFWMSRLPPKLRTFSIVHLAIPGSHNSMTYTINKNNDIGPDESQAIRTMGHYFSFLLKPVIFNWCINQNINVIEQLNGGIRYLDLRVAIKRNEEQIYFLHGLYGTEISQPLQEIASWLSTHPNEVIIIDFQHFYDFSEAHHRNLIEKVKLYFHYKICPVYNNMEHISLHWLNLRKYQVIIVYRNIIACNSDILWPTGSWPTPWPNTVSKSKLINFLNIGLQKRVQDIGYISQGILTPDTFYIVKHICGNLKQDLNAKCEKVLLPWIEENSPGTGGMNIVIADCVSSNNFLFSKIVIQRNTTLLVL